MSACLYDGVGEEVLDCGVHWIGGEFGMPGGGVRFSIRRFLAMGDHERRLLEGLAMRALLWVVIGGLLALVGIHLLGCGSSTPTIVGRDMRGMECARRCQDTGRDVKQFWQYVDVVNTVSAHCECL